MSRRRTIAQLLRAQVGLERAFRRRYAAALERYVRAAAAAYADTGLRGVRIALEGQGPEFHKLLTANYLTAGERFRKITMQQITAGSKDMDTQFEEDMLKYVTANAATRSALITGTTTDLIMDAIAEGIQEAETPAAIATRIRNTAGGAMSRLRADSIAITETHGAATYASDKTAEGTGLRLEREWASVEDARTRPTHVEADGQRVGMNEPFTVGGYQLIRPGDPAGPPEEVIRCRCVVLYHEE